jgi:NADPH:quinone reductase
MCRVYGPPESLVVEVVPDPVAGPGEAVVRIEAAAVNYPDLLLAANQYQISVPPPFAPGSEFAGVVETVGDGVTAVAPGDRVRGGSMVGGFAQRIAVSATGLEKLPDGVDLASAAAFHVAHATAYHALRSVGEVTEGDWVVVLGAAGGVGLAAVELAKVLGAKVLAAASSPAKLAVCTARGADAVVDYSVENLKDRIKEITGGGADVVIDPVGGAWSEEALRATRWGGRFVVVGFASGEIPRIPLNLVLLKGVVIKGFEIRTFSQFAPEAAARDIRELHELFASGQVSPHISATYPLEETGAALRSLADRTATGKVVILPWE